MSSSVRIRDNQRRSRARRKEYIHDLEQRLQKYQTEGIRATREVQEAGRKVAVENSLLRSLLILHGVSDQEVQEYLKAHTADICPPTSRPEAVLVTPSHSGQSPRLNTVDDSGGPIPSNNERDDTSPEKTATKPASSSSLVTYQQAAISDSQNSDGDSELSVPFDSPTPDIPTLQAPNRHQDSRQSGQCTPCETAAGIISSMRSYPNMQDVRSELGCHSSASCMVKNMDIFQLLNE
ncbi:hypothetical protein AbraIFM66951_011855 [Aspergillus brasiliensis]|uniref:BZIP domain-containing protein n=1 Tax=Aspergillus brasiliensis TaxID=319629 RepID=A0A9W5YY34_9EURO|nr:hypothetical protein AbraCBS73388_011727 [Aspergillus brasiliensis]GKZ48100.1 hypothetical protein AbraIFM66951_011855 [Aspergillus brasiliensis]